MNLLTAPGLTVESLTTHAINVCEERADALAIIDIENDYMPETETKSSVHSDTDRIGNVDDAVRRMKDREINIKVGNISNRQWPLLLVELNLVAKSWKKYGPVMNIKTKNFNKIIKWGKKRHGVQEEK